MEDLNNLIRREVHRVLAMNSKSQPGLVSGYDPETHSVKVLLQPEGNETGWIPLTSMHVGNDFGVLMAPAIDDQVEVTYQNGNPETGRITGRHFSDKEKPPNLKSGEILVKHKSGSKVFIDENGHITIEAAASKNITVKAQTITLEAALTFKGNITHTGNMTTSGVHTDSIGTHKP